MVKKSIMCNDCCYLDKKKKYITGVMFQYGCNCRLRNRHNGEGRTVGWIHSDSGLKTMGCSECSRLKTGTRIVVAKGKQKKKYLYCGSVSSGRLLYEYEKEKLIVVDDDYLSGKEIKVTALSQSEEEYKKSVREARKRRESLNEKHKKQ